LSFLRLGSISRELKNIVSKQERLEETIAKLEAELKLIRVEISDLKEKKKEGSLTILSNN